MNPHEADLPRSRNKPQSRVGRGSPLLGRDCLAQPPASLARKPGGPGSAKRLEASAGQTSQAKRWTMKVSCTSFLGSPLGRTSQAKRSKARIAKLPRQPKNQEAIRLAGFRQPRNQAAGPEARNAAAPGPATTRKGQLENKEIEPVPPLAIQSPPQTRAPAFAPGPAPALEAPARAASAAAQPRPLPSRSHGDDHCQGQRRSRRDAESRGERTPREAWACRSMARRA